MGCGAVAVFEHGSLIRMRREQLGVTQEDLADGICSVPTLSRLENGSRMPSPQIFQRLMERLGYSSMLLDSYGDKADFRARELEMHIRQCSMNGEPEGAREALAELAAMWKNPSPMNRQFLMLHHYLLYEDEFTPESALSHLEEALALTCPGYTPEKPPRLMSFDEIILLNNIALRHAAMGNKTRCIAILQGIREFYDRHVVFTEEALRTQPVVLYNLSKYLGQEERYDECIEICDLAIRLARRTGRCQSLAKTLYNRGWALLKRGRPEDAAVAEVSIRQAYCMSYAMEKQRDAEHIKAFYKKAFGDVLLK